MKFLPPGYNTKDSEKDVKNKWRWQWLTEANSDGQKLSEWLKKPEAAGTAYCDVCAKTINYRSNGKKALSLHSEDSRHKKNSRVIKSNQVLPGSSKATSATESLQDRIAKQRILIVSFLGEHCLPFSLADDLVKLAQRLGEDKEALQKTSLSKTSTMYISTHGVSKSMKDELRGKLKNKPVSLNIDEATTNNNDKILNILVQYFDEESGKVAVAHLGSRKQNLSTSQNILSSVKSVMDEYEMQWSQVVSMLMDNCSTMRGVRGGVETLVRQLNPYLLDISGDTVHMMNNAAKALLNSVDGTLQCFCSDIYYDIEESPKVRAIFQDVQMLLGKKTPKQLLRPISSRFLQVLDVCTRVDELWSCLTAYYFSFLSEEDKSEYRPLMSILYKDHKMAEDTQAAVGVIQHSQADQQKSVTSSDRKNRIVQQVFHQRTETYVKIGLFRGLLESFQGYVKAFQSEKPMMHILHEKLFETVHQTLGMFIKPEHIPDKVGKLVKLDVSDRQLQKSNRNLGVGKYAYALLENARTEKKHHQWIDSLYSNLRSGFVKAAKKMLSMPLGSKVLRQLTALDPHPDIVSNSTVSKCLKSLARQLPNIIQEGELGQLIVEGDSYSIDHDVRALSRGISEEDRIDLQYWTKVFQLKTFHEPRYPVLKKLVSSLLSIFTGPLVEGSFNVMDDIIEKDRANMTTENYEAVAIIKSTLKRRQEKAVTMTIPKEMKKATIGAYQTYQQHLQKKREKAEALKKLKLSNSIQQLKEAKVKHFRKLVRNKSRVLSETNKARKDRVKRRNNDESGSSTSRPWKRIKLS